MDLSSVTNTVLISFSLDPYKTCKSGFVSTVACEYLSYAIVTMGISLQQLGKNELLMFFTY